MALIKSYKGLTPKWGKDCYFSENATIVGEVTMGDQCSVWFNAVVRGDVAPITIGDRTNIQDGSCVHVTHETARAPLWLPVPWCCSIQKYHPTRYGVAFLLSISNLCVRARRIMPSIT